MGVKFYPTPPPPPISPSRFRVNWPGVQLYLKVPNHTYVLKWYVIHCLIYFGFIKYLYMYLFWRVFGGNSCVTENWVTDSGYAQLSFVKEIHAMYFVFDFSHEIRFFVYLVKSTRKFFHALKSFSNFAFVCCHYKITWYLDKVNQKLRTERVSNRIDTQSSSLTFMSFNIPPCLPPQTTHILEL